MSKSYTNSTLHSFFKDQKPNSYSSPILNSKPPINILTNTSKQKIGLDISKQDNLRYTVIRPLNKEKYTQRQTQKYSTTTL